MKLKDVNTTDLYAIDRGEPARVVLTGQLWKRDNFSRDSFPFLHTAGRRTQGRVGEGYHSYMVGHLAVVLFGTPTEADLTALRELELPAVTADTPQTEQYDKLREFNQQLSSSDTNLRLMVINTQRMKLWESAQAEKQAERETAERVRDEKLARQRAAVGQFNRLAPALSVYATGIDHLRTQVSYEAYAGGTPTVTLSLDALQQLLKDAAAGREAAQRATR